MPELTTTSAVSYYIAGDNSLATALTTHLAAAEDAIAQFAMRRDLAGVNWLAGSRTEYLDGEIAQSVLLKWTPINAITSVDIITSATTTYTYTLTDLEMDGLPIASLSATVTGQVGRLGLRNTFLTNTLGWQSGTNVGIPWGRFSIPNFGSGRKRVKVVYNGGYQTNAIPPSLIQAAKQLTAQLYYNRTRDPTIKSTTLGQFSESYGSAFIAGIHLGAVESLIMPYRCFSNVI